MNGSSEVSKMANDNIKPVELDYYYGMEADQFAFIKVPRILIIDSRFEKLSNDAKILYSLLLDRMCLSMKNKWLDSENRVYIIYKTEQIMIDLNVDTNKACKLLKALESYGLIERKKQGFGMPSLIYVKNFASLSMNASDKTKEKEEQLRFRKEQREKRKEEKRQENTENTSVLPKQQYENFQNSNTSFAEMTIRELPEEQYEDCQNNNTSFAEMTERELPEEQANYTNNSYTYDNQTDNNYTDVSETNHIKSYPRDTGKLASGSIDVQKRLMDEMVLTRQMLKENIDYESLVISHPHDIKKIDELVEIMVEACVSTSPTIRVVGEDKPQQIVASRFEKMTYTTMEYVLNCLKENTSKVHNIKSYLLTTLYNASLTIDNYYAAEVNHDLYGSE